MKTAQSKSKTTPAAPVQRRRANDPSRKFPEGEVNIPVAIETEQEVLGLFLLQPGAIQKAIETGLQDSLFFAPSHKIIYSAMKHIQDKGWSLTPKTLCDYLKGQHALEKIGGMAYIAELIDGKVSGPERLGGLIQQLKDIDYKRLVVRKSAELQRVAGNGASPAEIEEVIESIPRTHTTIQQYSLTPAGLIFRKPARFGFGFENERLTNFGAKIVSELIEDDGSSDEQRYFEMEVTLKGQARRIEVPASKFAAMQWPVSELGAEAIIFPAKADHARCAIQTLSPVVQKRTVYAHTGWRKIENNWVYLHSGGAIAGDGNRTDLSVRLPNSLRHFLLPEPAKEKAIKDAYQSTIDFLNAFPRHLTVPILGAVFASVLGDPDYSVFVTGQSGCFKSELTGLAMAFFGSGFNRLTMPANWDATANSLQMLAFQTKDALLVIDDFAPIGQKRHDDDLHNKAERVFRAAGNRAGKGRLNADTRQREVKEPRGLILASGEDTPKGFSVQNRLLIVPIDKGEIGTDELTKLQMAAREGKFAISLSTFISYFARNYDSVKSTFETDRLKFRDWFHKSLSGHARQPTTMAHIAAAWRAWVSAAFAEKAISKEQAQALLKEIQKTLAQSGEEQKEQQGTLHPAEHFFELLRSALTSGSANLQTIEGDEPPEIGKLCGWRNGQPNGRCVGWVDDEITYLEPKTAYLAAHSQGFQTGEGLAVSQNTLWKRLDERGMIAIKAPGRGNKVRTPRSQIPAIAVRTDEIFARGE